MSSIKCPACSKSLRVPEGAEGKRATCSCGHRFVIGAPIPPKAPQIRVPCECGKQLAVPSNLVGKLLRCPSCEATIRVPDPGKSSDAPVIATGIAAASKSGSASKSNESSEYPDFGDFPSASEFDSPNSGGNSWDLDNFQSSLATQPKQKKKAALGGAGSNAYLSQQWLTKTNLISMSVRNRRLQSTGLPWGLAV